MNKPKLLILDEPTVGVDRENVISFYKTINELHSEGITIILITHNIKESNANFTHILSIVNGESMFKELEEAGEMV